MNQKEKLTEATIKALQGKLIEESAADKYKAFISEIKNSSGDLKELIKIQDKYGVSNYYQRDNGNYVVTFWGVTPHILLDNNGEWLDYLYPDEFPYEDEEDLDENKLTEDSNLNARDNNCEVIINKNQFGYTTIGIIIDNNNKEFQLVDGQRLPLGKYKKTTKKAIYDKANELEAMGYKKVKGTYSITEGTGKERKE